MTFVKEFTAYCAICGGPIEDPDINQGWLSQATLLHCDNSELSTSNVVLEFPARNMGGPYFEVVATGETVTACDVSGSVVPSPKPLYIPCHSKCISIAKRVVVANKKTLHHSVNDLMQHIWRILKGYFEKASEGKFRPICNIYSAQAYGDIWRFQELVWEPGEDPALRFESMHFEADPEVVSGLTEVVLSHLEILPQDHQSNSLSGTSELPPAKDLAQECDFVISSSTWRKALLLNYLPWLWDLEPQMVADKQLCKPPGQEWNWELLVRRLSIVNIHEPKAVFEDLPIGLRNRRRIWRIVDDMLVAGR